MAKAQLTLRVRLPWWWRVYLGALIVLAWCRVPIDEAAATKHVVDSIRFDVI